MSNPISFRFPFESQIASLPPEIQMVHRTTWNAITDLQGAIPSLKSQIDDNKTAITAATTTSTSASTSSETIVQVLSQTGFVNNQVGATSYTTQQSDYGAFLLLGDSSAVTITLAVAPSIQTPYNIIVINFGTSTVTLTPQSGTIRFGTASASSSMPLLAGYSAFIAFDGTNFFAAALPIVPVNTPAITHEWLASYNSTTGVFSQSQPAFSDLSGNLATSQLPTAGLSVTVTTAKLTSGGTNGSMTFTNGILTAQTPAT